MTRGLIALSAATLALAAAGGAAASHGPGDGGPAGDFVSGSAHYEQNAAVESIVVAARSGPTGEDPRGHIMFRANPSLFEVPVFGIDGRFHGDVSKGCLLVVGNRAVAIGELPPEEQFNVPPPAPQPFVIEFIGVVIDDNGHPAEGQPVDMAAPIFLRAASAQAFCAGTSIVPTAPFEHGNFVVHDGVGG